MQRVVKGQTLQYLCLIEDIVVTPPSPSKEHTENKKNGSINEKTGKKFVHPMRRMSISGALVSLLHATGA